MPRLGFLPANNTSGAPICDEFYTALFGRCAYMDNSGSIQFPDSNTSNLPAPAADQGHPDVSTPTNGADSFLQQHSTAIIAGAVALLSLAVLSSLMRQ